MNQILKKSIIKQKLKKRKLLKAIKEAKTARLQFPSGDEMDANYRRIKYTRYADDFLS